VNSPVVSRSAAICRLPYQSAAAMPSPRAAHERRQHRQRARHLHVGAVDAVRGRRETPRLLGLGANAFTDAVPGERLGGEVRQVLQLLLAAPGRAAHALAEAHERVDDDRAPVITTSARRAS